MDGIDADPKGNCHRLVRKKIDQSVEVWPEEGETRSVKTGRGVRQ